jgi:hypothetical protein
MPTTNKQKVEAITATFLGIMQPKMGPFGGMARNMAQAELAKMTEQQATDIIKWMDQVIHTP